MLDALAESRHEDVASLARELAPGAGRQVDVFNRTIETLEYHSLLDVLVEAIRIAWPGAKSSDEIFPSAIAEFAEKGVSHEIFEYLEHAADPDPADPILLDRVRNRPRRLIRFAPSGSRLTFTSVS